MSVGMILLIAVTVLIFLGLGERVLDKLRLSDKAAVVILIAMIVSTIWIPNIELTRQISINIGGFLIPMGLSIYLLVKADTNKERVRAIIGALVAGALIYISQRYLLPAEPENQWIDPNYVYGLIGGLVAYLIGRSRRGAFVAGVTGVVISDLIQLTMNWINQVDAPTRFGGAGAVDTTVIAGVLGVLIAEIIGETREKIQGGTDKKDMHFEDGHFVPNRNREKDASDKRQEGGE